MSLAVIQSAKICTSVWLIHSLYIIIPEMLIYLFVNVLLIQLAKSFPVSQYNQNEQSIILTQIFCKANRKVQRQSWNNAFFQVPHFENYATFI